MPSPSRLGWSGLLSRGGAGEGRSTHTTSSTNKKTRSNWEEIITVVTPSDENNQEGTTMITNTPVVIVSSSSSSSSSGVPSTTEDGNNFDKVQLQNNEKSVNRRQSPFSPSSSSLVKPSSLAGRRAYTASCDATADNNIAPVSTNLPTERPCNLLNARRTRSLTSSDVHFLTSPTLPTNAKLLPLTTQYDINDTLLGLFTSTYNNGHTSLAYAVGTRYVEVALYRIPQHDYYYHNENNEEYNNEYSTMNESDDRTTTAETLLSPSIVGNRRTRSAANALWVTSLLGGMMTTATAATSVATPATTTVDERIETLRKLAIEARKAFEEALDDEQQQQQKQEGKDVDEDVRNSRIRLTRQQQKRKGGDRADADIFTTWKEYIRNKGGTGLLRDQCGSLDGISFENICTFWNNACSTTTTTSSDDDDDNMMMMDDNNNDDDKRQNRRNTNKIDVASLPELPGPIELPQVFIRRDEKVVEKSVAGQRMLMQDEEDVNYSCPLDVIDPNRRRSDIVTNTTSTTMNMDVITSPTATSYDNALNISNEIMSMEIDGTYSIMTEEPACPTTITMTTTKMTNQEEIKGTISLSAVARARQLLSHRHRSTDGSSSNQKLQLQRHISVDSSGFDKDALQMALDLSIQQQQQQQQQQISKPPICNIGDVNVVSSSSSEVTLGSMMEVVESGGVAGNFDSIMSMTLLYREQYRAMYNCGKFHIHFLNTYQGRNPSTTNGCTVIAPLTCVQYFTSSEEKNVVNNKMETMDELSPWNNGIPDRLINYVIDEHAASILPDVRRKLRLDHDAFIIPSDVHDHLIDMGLLSTSQFVSVCGGNILDDNHLHSFKMSLLLLDDERERMRLKGRKTAATFFFHGHVIALHVIRKNGKEDDVSIELIDSLPDPRTWVTRRPSNVGQKDRFSQSTPRWGNIRQQLDDNEDDDDHGLSMNAVRIRCTDIEHFDTLIRHYACSKFSSEERQFMDTTAWEDNNGYCEYSFDPRVFQAFIWAESESM